jgi:hypothetical protein
LIQRALDIAMATLLAPTPVAANPKEVFRLQRAGLSLLSLLDVSSDTALNLPEAAAKRLVETCLVPLLSRSGGGCGADEGVLHAATLAAKTLVSRHRLHPDSLQTCLPSIGSTLSPTKRRNVLMASPQKGIVDALGLATCLAASKHVAATLWSSPLLDALATCHVPEV